MIMWFNLFILFCNLFDFNSGTLNDWILVYLYQNHNFSSTLLLLSSREMLTYTKEMSNYL